MAEHGAPVRLLAEDANELAAMEKTCFSTPWSADQFRSAFSGKSFYVYGLREEGVLRCYLALIAVADEMEILNLATHPDFRRRGLARRLLGAVLQLVENMGIKREYLEVRVSNLPALALYESFGFVKTGLRKRYYSDTGEDAVLMLRPAPGGE